jgi:diguanylate cyclase (GGDEF)-like protein/PAS domain S-box-containing protein
MNIRKKFVVFSILWGVIPVIVLASISISNFNSKNVEMIKQNVAILTNDQAIHLKDFFDQNISSLNINRNVPMIRDLLTDSNNRLGDKNRNENAKILNEILSNNKNGQFFLSKELIINKDEVIVASNDDKDIDKKIELSNEEIQRLSHNEVVVTGIIQRDDFNDGIKSAIIASPIFFKNEYQGSIANVINMSYFEKLVNDVQFFKTGKIAIVDETGLIAATSSKDLQENINENNTSSNLGDLWKKIDFNNNPNGIIEYKMNGIEKIGYYSTISNTGWIVLSGVEWAEFKTPIEKSIQNVTILLMFIILLIITSYTFTINHFSKPIYRLLEVIRKIKQGHYRDRFIYNEDNEFGEIAIAFNDLIDTIERNKKHIEDKNRDLQSLTSNIPGGVYRCRIENERYFLYFVSSGCLNFLGYENHEFKRFFNRNLIELIYEKDRERITNEIREQLSKYNKYNVEYRIKKKDGSIVWLLDNGQIVKNRNGKLYSYNVVINITESKTIQEEHRLSEERYRIIVSQTEDIIFEWNIRKDDVHFSGNWKNKFNYKPVIINISQKIYKTDNIHKDDIKKLGKILNDIIYGEVYKETEIRIKKNTNEYIWCKIRITAMFDENGNILKAIGIIIDIDEEKRKAEELLYKAQRDSLTGLYNKGTAQSMVEEYIKNEGKNVNGALFLIDIDNFKTVNDTLGHLAGDSVLTNISSMFSEIFQENSIVGRIGGDEFIIYLKNINSEELICEKAEELVNGFRSNFAKEILNYKVSGSVGIAKYPEHGKSFKELFINADKAAYLAKNKGKDNYCIFEEI